MSVLMLFRDMNNVVSRTKNKESTVGTAETDMRYVVQSTKCICK